MAGSDRNSAIPTHIDLDTYLLTAAFAPCTIIKWVIYTANVFFCHSRAAGIVHTFFEPLSHASRHHSAAADANE